MVYQLQTKEARLQPLGTPEIPFLYAISGGQRNNESLIFYFKIGENFHECHIDQIKLNFD